MTIQKPPLGQCSVLTIAFQASKGEDIGGTFGAQVPIDLYIINQNDLNAFTQSTNNCVLPTTANPLFTEQNVAGTHNSYNAIPIPSDGMYYYVFIYHNNGAAQLSNNYADVYLTYPTFITLITSQSATNVMTSVSLSTSSTITSSAISTLLMSSMSVISSTTSGNMFANTAITISNLCIGGNCDLANSSYTAPLQNGAASAKVTFDVTYSNLPSGSSLFYGVYQATNMGQGLSGLYVPGLGSSTPDECTPLGTNQTVAVCGTNPITSTSVTESVSFVLNFNSTETTYTLQAWAWAANGPNTFSQFARSQPFEIIVKTSPITPGIITIFGFQIALTSLLQAVSGIALSGGGIIIGFYHKNRKRRTLSSYITKIDSTYKEYALNRNECITRLEQLKQDIIQLLNKGKIDESHFQMLDEKIKDYLIDLTQKSEHIAQEVLARTPISGKEQTKGKFCAECGTHLAIEDKTCHNCGSAQD